MRGTLAEILFGRRLASLDAEARRIGWFEAVRGMGLDALGSASYGPEAALTILTPPGVAGLDPRGDGAGDPGARGAVILLLAALVMLLLAALDASYRQTVVAYPNNGGGSTVSRENLGRDASLLAAASLMVDYMLNVALGICGG